MSKRRLFSEDEPVELEVQKDVIVPPAPTPPAPPVAEPPGRQLPMVALDVFCQASGKKPDQAKGFAGWAKRQGLVGLTMPEWHEKWQQFQSRPV